MESRQDSLWVQGTRRYTRSVSNQEKEAKEKLLNFQNDSKNGDSSSDGNAKKKENVGAGHVVRGPNNEVVEYVTEDGVSYKISDSAYVATERSDHPYSISTIQEIKPFAETCCGTPVICRAYSGTNRTVLPESDFSIAGIGSSIAGIPYHKSKKDNAVVTLRWFYRPSEVPDSVYQMMVKDRLDATDIQAEKELILKTEVRNRELFVADDDDGSQAFPVSALRGKCNVKYLGNYQHIKDYDLTPDHFFYVLGYNPLTRRLTNIQGEVKVGSSHQWTASTRGVLYKANIPECMSLPPPSTERVNHDYEEMIWEPRAFDCDLLVYLQSARSMAVFAGMCDGGSTEEGCAIASRDDTTINAMNVLFQCGGDARLALQTLVKKPLPLTIERKWTEDQVKRFQKGLRQNGKNFHKIKKDQLPSKDTSELVEFYYLWKKFQDTLMVLPQSKLKRQAALKRNAKTATPTTENGEGSSSENESVETDESGKESMENVCCNHCHTTTSEDWDIGGKGSVMLCTKCRVTFKKYGADIQLEIDLDNQTPSDFGETERRTPLSSLFPDASDVQAPPFLFKPIKEKMKDHHKTSSEEDDRAETPEVKKTKKRRWKAKKEETREEINVKEKRIKTEESEDSLSIQSIKTPLSDTENETNSCSDRMDKEIKEEVEAPFKSDPISPHRSSSTTTHLPPAIHVPAFTAPTRASLPPESGVYSKNTCSKNPTEQESLRKRAPGGETVSSYQPTYYTPSGVHPGHTVKSEHGNGSSMQIFQRFPIPPQSITSNPATPSLPPVTENVGSIPRPALFTHGGTPRVDSERTSQVGKSTIAVEPQTQSAYDPIHSRRKSSDKSASGNDRAQRTPAATSSSSDVTNRVNLTEQAYHGRTDTKSGSVVDKIPLIEVEDDDDEPIITPRILPEHHITLPAGKGYPINFRLYNDGIPDFRRSGQPTIVQYGHSKMSGYPGFLCSRTDLEWVPATVVKKEFKQQQKPTSQVKVSNAKTSSEKERDTLKPKPKSENINPPEHVTANREPPRSYPSSHLRVPSRGPAHGRLSTPSNLHNPPIPVDPSNHPPAHSSPYPVLGPGTPAIEQLRQYANIDSQREFLSGLIPHSQLSFPYHMSAAERDLRERELRERELRERMPKQGLPNVKLFESLDPHAAAQVMALQGFHPAAVSLPQSLLDQFRQGYSATAMGMPGAPQVVPGSIPGFPAMFSTNPDLLQQNPSEVDRHTLARFQAERAAALEQYRMELLHNHQHSHVHSHLHLHPQNHPPHGTSVFPPSVPQVNEAMMNPYTAALALQSQAALAAGVDPVHAAASMNPMLNMSGVRHPAIMAGPGVQVIPSVIPGADPSMLLSQSQLQAAVHENLLEHQRAAAAHQIAQQQDYLMRLAYAPKP